MTEVSVTASMLTRSVLVSIGIALVALVLFVLPAEYGIDPLGAGELMGIDGMAGYSVAALTKEEGAYHSDRVQFPLAPFESIEYKYTLHQGQALVYRWWADGELVFDLHAEEEGTDPEDSVSFSVGRGAEEQGTYSAPFDGVHGWFWENRGAKEVIVTLESVGYYEDSTVYSASGEFKKSFPQTTESDQN
ncbi:MAG: hypothetical protein AAF541_08090 [Pseudomonadota bacterium]